MKTKIICVILIAAVMLAGCADDSAAGIDINPAEVAQVLLREGGFEDTSTISALSQNLVDSYYDMTDAVTDYAIYVDGSGATAREVAVLKTESSGDAAKAREILDARLKTLTREFENYQPGELQKINNSVIGVKGNIAYMVVTDDPGKARDAIDALYK